MLYSKKHNMKLYRLLGNYWPILAVTLLGALFRFTNLNWDLGGRLHPDEALIVNGALEIIWPINLFHGFHDYNGFSVYLLKALSFGTNVSDVMTHIGRGISAALSTLTIIIIFFLGKKLWNKDIGLLASLFLASAPLSIQLAHFYTTESIIIFLLTLLSYTCASYYTKPMIKIIVYMGVLCGLLLATKNTGYLFLPIPVLTIMMHKKRPQSLFLLGLFCVSTFFITSPYSFLDFQRYLIRSQYLSDVVSGKLLMDWTIQFQNTNGLFWVKNLFVGFGPMIIFGLLGSITILAKTKKIQANISAIFSLWSLGFLIFLMMTYLKFIRYSAPLLPFVSLFAAKFLWDISKKKFGSFILPLMIVMQIIWGVMFFHIYQTRHTSLVARDWIIENLPAHSIIVREAWNNVIHFDTAPLLGKQYGFITINLYTLPDTNKKFNEQKAVLQNAHYFISESPKVQNTINHLSPNYPYTNQLYKGLQDGTLGFKQVATFTSYPQLGPITLNDERTEETFTVFDHPTIRIYKNLNK